MLSISLRRDADLQDSADYEAMGLDFDEIDAQLDRSRATSTELIAIQFWDAWLDERNHDFVGNYKGIEKGNWPTLARMLALNLQSDTPITNNLMIDLFGPQTQPSLMERIRRVLARNRHP